MKKKQRNSNARPSKPTSVSMKAYSIVKDQTSKPLFVLVPYAVWQEAKRAGNKGITKKTQQPARRKSVKSNPWAKFSGILGKREDALEYQRRLRSEWS